MSGVFVEGWMMPDSCVECPFFKVTVANASIGSFVSCKLLKIQYELSDLEWMQTSRDNECPLKWEYRSEYQ